MTLIEILEMYLEDIRKHGKRIASENLSRMVDDSLFQTISSNVSASGRFKRILPKRAYNRISKRTLGYDK